MASSARASSSSGAWTGRPLAVYRLRGWLQALQWFAIIVGLTGTLATAGVGLWRWTLAYTHYGPAVVWRWSLPWLLASVGLAPMFLLGFISFLRTRRTAVALYPSGLIYRRRGRRVQVPWQEIQRLTLTGPWSDLPLLRQQGQPAGLVIHTQDDKKVRLTHDLAQFEDLVAEIKRNVYPRMERAYAQAFNRGQALHFGPVSLDQEGVRVRRNRYPWLQVVAAELHRGNLRIRLAEGGGSVEVPVTEIPNAELCAQMIQRLTEET